VVSRGIDWPAVVEQAAVRAIRESLLEATAHHWRRRAEDFRRVGTPACDQVALACERAAELALVGGSWPEVDDVLAELGEAS
jgi:hypothetical protein